jgi:sugar (pentulose or hexulose) kinase
MTECRKVAVLDIGKTNAKVVVLDCATGEEIGGKRIANRVSAGPPYPHYDIEALWAFTLSALADLLQEPGYDAISITTHGASAVLLDDQGGLALPVLDYEHHYSQDVEEAYRLLRPPFSETFSPSLSGGLNIGAQLYYQKTVFPEDFARTRIILTYPQYWAYRLTGVAASEVTSLGCHTDLWNPRENRYSSLIDTLGIRGMMAPVRSAFDALGPVLPEIASRIGLTKPVPVHCGIHDSNASLLAHVIGRQPPFSVVSTGTWVVNFAVGGNLDHLDPARDTLANVDAYSRPVPSARFMGGREFELLTAELGPLSIEETLAAVPAVIERHMMLLPNIAEGSGPFQGQHRTWLNAAGADAQQRWATACLYLALMTETCLDLVGAKGPTLVEGPFSSNTVYLKALRSLLGRPVLALPGSTGTAQGAALLAAPHALPQAGTQIDGLAQDVSAYRRAWHDAIRQNGKTDKPALSPVPMS